jgi:hypothetical protein
VVFGVELKPQEVMQVMMASHYLDVPELLDISCSMIAHHHDGPSPLLLHLQRQENPADRNIVTEVESFDNIPPDAMMLILSHLSPENLMALERSEQVAHHPLDTGVLWRRAVEKKGWEPSAKSIVCAWEPELARTRNLIELADERLRGTPSKRSRFSEEDVNWKRLYAQKELQRRVDSFTGTSVRSPVCLRSPETLY